MTAPNPPLRVPLVARVIETVPDGRVIVTRLAETIIIEHHTYEACACMVFEVRREDAKALALALEELSK